MAVLAFFVFFKSFGLDLKTRSSVQAFLLTHGISFRNLQKRGLFVQKKSSFLRSCPLSLSLQFIDVQLDHKA